MDLASLDTSKKSAEGAIMFVRHPVNNSILEHDKGKSKEKMFIKLLGRDSKEFMAAAQGKELLSDDKTIDDETLAAASITVGGSLFLNGEWLELTAKNAVDIYQKYRWILEQVTIFALDRTNFFPDQNQI